MDSEARSFVEPLQLMAGGLHGTKFSGEPGGWAGEGDRQFDGAVSRD